MEYSVILSFLDYLRMLPNDNEYKRRALVNIFINAIYLYDGYFTMILNAGNRPLSVENIPLEDIEKTFENDDVGCSSNSQLVADAPPQKRAQPFGWALSRSAQKFSRPAGLFYFSPLDFFSKIHIIELE